MKDMTMLKQHLHIYCTGHDAQGIPGYQLRYLFGSAKKYEPPLLMDKQSPKVKVGHPLLPRADIDFF